jgi:integrase
MATLYRNKTSWYVQYQQHGQRHKKKLGKVKDLSKKEALVMVKAKEIELSTGQIILSTGIIFSNFAKSYIDWYATEYPTSYYRAEQIIRQYLVPNFAALPLDAIAPALVEQYKSLRLKSAKTATVTKELRTLKAMINKAIEWGMIKANPIQFVKAPKQLDSKPPHFYTVEELKLIYSASSKAPVWQLYANTGLRRMEGLNLKRKDVGIESIRVLSTDDDRTKSGKWREIPLTENAKEALDQLGKEIYVLPRIRPESLSRAFIIEAGRIGVGGSLHSLRHSYASHLVMAGVPLRTVQKLMGHAHFTTTERYAHLAPGYLHAEGTRINL